MKINTLEELISQIDIEIKLNGNNANLNHLDVSNLRSLTELFFKFPEFNGDISKWDVSNVKHMIGTFKKSKFNGDISMWDVSSVLNMEGMFSNSLFDGDISKWKVFSVENMSFMFRGSVFNKDLSNWKLAMFVELNFMFYNSKFNKSIKKWKLNNSQIIISKINSKLAEPRTTSLFQFENLSELKIFINNLDSEDIWNKDENILIELVG